MARKQAIQATVTGQDQQVGFRALVMKQAIASNLAGVARNQPNSVVRFTLQGDKDRIDAALPIIQDGTTRSADLKIATVPVVVNPDLKSFTIVDWTSSSRNITDPYTLVFRLRDDDTEISAKDAKLVWRGILEKTLNDADRAKLQPDD